MAHLMRCCFLEEKVGHWGASGCSTCFWNGCSPGEPRLCHLECLCDLWIWGTGDLHRAMGVICTPSGGSAFHSLPTSALLCCQAFQRACPEVP